MMEIYTLGRFEVIKGERVLTEEVSRVSKLWKMFQYLFTYRRRDVPNEEMISVLDLEKNSYPVGSLTALVYRLRKLLGEGEKEEKESFILTRGSAYSFNKNANYWMDAEEFSRLCVKTGELAEKKSRQAYETYLEALELYNGDYLDDLKSEEWIWNARNRYRDMLVSTLNKLDKLMKDLEMYEELWQIYERSQDLVRFDEDLIRGSIEALLASGNAGLARIKYDEIVELYRENDLKLPPDIKGLKSRLDSRNSKDPSPYLQKMLNSRPADEAYVCDPETFTRLYDLEKRRSQRQDNPRYLVHLTLECTNSNAVIAKGQDQVGSQQENDELECLSDSNKSLLEILQHQLRRGDVVCRWSEKHFIVMLVNLNSADVKNVLERIEDSFKNQNDYFGQLELKSRYYLI